MAGGGQPKWRDDGKELFYVSGRGELMAVAVREEDDVLELGMPEALFELPSGQALNTDHYAVARDGQRFLVKLPLGTDEPDRLHVVLNWPALLGRSRR